MAREKPDKIQAVDLGCSFVLTLDAYWCNHILLSLMLLILTLFIRATHGKTSQNVPTELLTGRGVLF